ncbi:hypothetical protein RM780_10860 [Streptomyces sp. DSM 44917]|uniref:Antitoxin n=1 Tax=Streptomyces boetiae TaxID=3075541 RepID=A0ABU2L7Z8_9ACTN|nr:hypothetical protein [Streptomyces sp. DSM 44917]MDT0307462.1 hypothetical protein [Streptomyces sp. DSM 44917]
MDPITALTAEVRDDEETAPDGCISVQEAATRLGALAARVGSERRRVALTDRDAVLALVISVEDWENLRDALAVARTELDRLTALGTSPARVGARGGL